MAVKMRGAPECVGVRRAYATWGGADRVAKALSEASTHFSRAAEPDLEWVLGLLGEAVGASRAYIFMLRDGGRTIDNTHEWCAPGVEPQIGNLQGLDPEVVPWWMERLRRHETILIEDVGALGEEARAEREMLEAQDIVSVLVVPVATRDGDLEGFLGFDDTEGRRAWTESDLRALEVVAEMIAGELERRRAQEQLRGRERLLADAEDLAGVGSWELFPQTGEVRWSDGMWRIHGRERVDDVAVIRELFPDAVHPRDRRRVADGLKRLRERGGSYEMEYRIVRPDGSVRTVLGRGHGELDGDGRVTRALGILQDVTERVEAEAALRRSEEQLFRAQKMEAVGRLAGGIAHDFNNLLTAIRGNTEFLLERAESVEDRRDLEEIRRSVDRATALTSRILAFSRSQVLDITPLDLNQVVRDAKTLVDRLIGDDIRVVVNLDDSLSPVRADAGQLDQVILNLAVNARDAMPGGGTLTIATREVELAADSAVALEPGRYARLRVSDTGHGMDRATVAKIFDPFFTTKKEGEGTGLGLSTVYGILRQLEGAVAVESEPGEGSTFDVYLPTTDEPARPRDGGAGRHADECPVGAGETIVVAEDDRAVSSLVRRALEKAGYTVVEAATGEEALQFIESGEPFDLLVTDLVMPELGGWELAERLEWERPGTKILLMSGHSPGRGHDVPLRTHIPFLAKPFGPAELERKVREVLDG